MRFDRLITLNVARPLSALGRGLGRGAHNADVISSPSDLGPRPSVFRLPILMYHSISNEPEPDRSPYYKVNTSPATFRRQMQFLADNGYRTLTVSELTHSLFPFRDKPFATRHSPFAIHDSPQADSHSGSSLTSVNSSRPHPNLNPNPSSGSPSLPSLPSVKKPCSIHDSLSQYVVLTFDDGFLDFYTEAFPVLREFGFTATMFLPTGLIGQSSLPSVNSSIPNHNLNHNHNLNPSSVLRPPASANPLPPASRSLTSGPSSVISPPSSASPLISDSRPLTPGLSSGSQLPFAGKQFLNWDQVRELHRNGIEFGSHTVTHPKLVDLSWDQIEGELRNSRSGIEAELGEACTTFCYPYAFPSANGKFVDRFRTALKQAGYTTCTTTEIGTARSGDDPFALKRLPINDCDDLELFKAKLEGAYDWLAGPQAIIKRLKQFRSAGRTRNFESRNFESRKLTSDL